MALSLEQITEQPRHKGVWGKRFIFVLLILASLFYVAPVYVMIANGLKDKSYMTLEDMWKLPRNLSGGGFSYAWDALRPSMWNSLAMAIPATIGSSLLGAVNGYLLSKWKFKGSDLSLIHI